MKPRFGLMVVKPKDMSLNGKPAKTLYSPNDFKGLRKYNMKVPKELKKKIR